MSKIIHLIIVVGLVNLILYLVGEYLLNYFNFIFYHISLGAHIFLSKFLAESTVSFISSSVIGAIYVSIVLIFINLIKD